MEKKILGHLVHRNSRYGTLKVSFTVEFSQNLSRKNQGRPFGVTGAEGAAKLAMAISAKGFWALAALWWSIPKNLRILSLAQGLTLNAIACGNGGLLRINILVDAELITTHDTGLFNHFVNWQYIHTLHRHDF